VRRAFAHPALVGSHNSAIEPSHITGAHGRGYAIMKKRSIAIAGRKTSISLEDVFWSSLQQIAMGRHETLSGLVAAIDADRQHANLSSAIRLFVLDYYREQFMAAKISPPSRAPDVQKIA
jgi:predicted DNA-binding ribbon-helix-helix protein